MGILITPIKVIYVHMEFLYPAFGFSIPSKRLVFVGMWLPKSVKKAVEEHEKYHILDKSTNSFWREVKANFHALCRQPMGQLYTIYLSLTDLGRLRFYWNRFFHEKKENESIMIKLKSLIK